MWAVPDEILLAAVSDGDPQAVAVFTRRYQRRVYGLARVIVGDGAAEDVAQEAFIKAWRHAGAYDVRRGSALTWVLTITRNVAIDALRVRRPEPVDPEVVARLESRVAAPEASPAGRAELAEDTSRLRAALAELVPEQRRAVVLATIGGRSAREISEYEGIPLGTAKTRIRTGLHRLRAALSSDQEIG